LDGHGFGGDPVDGTAGLIDGAASDSDIAVEIERAAGDVDQASGVDRGDPVPELNTPPVPTVRVALLREEAPTVSVEAPGSVRMPP